MKEISHLKTMWGPKIRRSTELIVPRVTFTGADGSLHNEDWHFQVPYAFRDALDIEYEERKKNKIPYMIWTQGPILDFKVGDMLHEKNGDITIQIQFANPVGWDSVKKEMYEGNVIYEKLRERNGKMEKLEKITCSQVKFLQFLIYGAKDC